MKILKQFLHLIWSDLWHFAKQMVGSAPYPVILLCALILVLFNFVYVHPLITKHTLLYGAVISVLILSFTIVLNYLVQTWEDAHEKD